ncbi:unannotated protein [freshwater metagenome]|uniref:Unannotated protein n=1 Tax=freshwater metagenome TaxID=449393 RepID=A0A6J6GZN1_9ZZZZ
MSERRNISMETITATYDTAFIENNHAVPSGPMSAAAIAGPKIREPVITVVLRDIALEISSGSTNSVTKPRRDGLSMAFAIPSTNDNE